MEKDKLQKENSGEYSRRRFLKISGLAAMGLGVGGTLQGLIWIDEAIAAVPAADLAVQDISLLILKSARVV